MKRRRQYIRDHEIDRFGDRKSPSPFVGFVFCGKCGKRFCRHDWHRRGVEIWQCKDYYKWKGGSCKSRAVTGETLDKVFVIAWNSLVAKRSMLAKKWNEMIENGDALEKIKGKQMIELTYEGKITRQVPELTRMVLERIEIYDETIKVVFLDGSIKNVAI